MTLKTDQQISNYATNEQLELFLREVEKRAFVMAQIATHHREDALDIVQDAMTAFVTRYSNKPDAEWSPLFYRILQNRIRDWYRRVRVRQAFHWFSVNEDANLHEQIQTTLGRVADEPVFALQQQGVREEIICSISRLSLRQQQVFLLRIWEGLSVKETAKAMQCSQGSVKTHLSRATEHLRYYLKDIESDESK